MWNKILYIHIHEMKYNEFDLQQNIIILRTNYYLYIYTNNYIYIKFENMQIYENFLLN